MNKKNLKEYGLMVFNYVVIPIISVIIGLTIANGINDIKNTKTEKEVFLIELGVKISDLKWLAREGKLSEEEIEKFNESARNINYEKLDQLLDKLLEGKEDESIQKISFVFE